MLRQFRRRPFPIRSAPRRVLYKIKRTGTQKREEKARNPYAQNLETCYRSRSVPHLRPIPFRLRRRWSQRRRCHYKGVYDPDFLELIDITENEAEETYLSSLETEADFFASAFLIDDLTDELKAEVVDMYKQVYAKAKYTVDTATEVDDSTFGVKVTVEPLDVFDRVAEALWGDTPDARAEALYSQDVDSMTDEEYAAYDAEWCRLVIDLTLEKLPEAEYLEAQSKVVQITLGDDNYWSLDEQDFSDLDWLILDYNF